MGAAASTWKHRLKTQVENTGFAVCNIADWGITGLSAAIDTEEENPDIKTD